MEALIVTIVLLTLHMPLLVSSNVCKYLLETRSDPTGYEEGSIRLWLNETESPEVDVLVSACLIRSGFPCLAFQGQETKDKTELSNFNSYFDEAYAEVLDKYFPDAGKSRDESGKYSHAADEKLPKDWTAKTELLKLKIEVGSWTCLSGTCLNVSGKSEVKECGPGEINTEAWPYYLYLHKKHLIANGTATISSESPYIGLLTLFVSGAMGCWWYL
jgi:hypothetical protein